MFMSESQEIRLGSEYDPQVIASFGLYENEPLMELIEEKGREMGKVSHRPELEYHFRILDTPVINAFAVPGGYIYFTRGILAQFNNEAEMMGVLGHELGHITARHSASRYTKQQLGQLLLIGGIIVSEEFRKYGQYAMVGMQLLFLSFSREDEREADRLGVEYSSKLGYDARKKADFFEVLKKMRLDSEQGGIPTFLSTHPDPGDRYNSVIREAEKWQDSLDFSSWEVNREGYLQMLDGMVYGEDPRQGYVEDNVFYHPNFEFRFAYPSGWELENSALQVTMAPGERDALMIFAIAREETLSKAVDNTMSNLEVDVTQKRETTVNGMPAIAVQATQTLEQSGGETQTLRILSYFIDYDDTYYGFVGVSDERDYNKYSSLFESSMISFDKLTDESKINVEPTRISIKEVQKEATLADAFRSFDVPEEKMEEFAFLNNMELKERVEPGTLLKIGE